MLQHCIGNTGSREHKSAVDVSALVEPPRHTHVSIPLQSGCTLNPLNGKDYFARAEGEEGAPGKFTARQRKLTVEASQKLLWP